MTVTNFVTIKLPGRTPSSFFREKANSSPIEQAESLQGAMVSAVCPQGRSATPFCWTRDLAPRHVLRLMENQIAELIREGDFVEVNGHEQEISK
jgi:hypothetical protein